MTGFFATEQWPCAIFLVLLAMGAGDGSVEAKAVPGLPDLGDVQVLAEFAFAMPSEGTDALALGYALRVKEPAALPAPPEVQRQVDQAFSQVRGLQLTLPLGAWPAEETQAPGLWVVDPGAAASGPLAVEADALALKSALVILLPVDLVLLQPADMAIPVARSIARAPNNSDQMAAVSLAAHQFRDRQWRHVGGTMRKGLDSWSSPSGNASAAAYDLLTVQVNAFGPTAVMQSLVEPLHAQDHGGNPSAGLGFQWIWIILVAVFGAVVVLAVCWRIWRWRSSSQWRAQHDAHEAKMRGLSAPADAAESDLEQGKLTSHKIYADDRFFTLPYVQHRNIG